MRQNVRYDNGVEKEQDDARCIKQTKLEFRQKEHQKGH